MDNTISKFFEVLDEIVRGDDRPWREKAAWVLENASPDDKTNLAEFVAWFDGVNDDA